MKPVLLCLALFSLTLTLPAQTILTGLVTDGEHEPVIFGSVALYKGDILITGGETDFDGRFTIEVEPGLYQLEASYLGLETHRIEEVMVHEGETNQLDLKMENAELTFETLTVVGCSRPLVTKCFGYACPLRKRVILEDTPEEEAIPTTDYSMECFPNPTTDQVTVTLTEPMEAMRLYDLNGQMLNQWVNLEAGQQMIDLSDHPSGTYLLEATSEGQRWMAKVIVQR